MKQSFSITARGTVFDGVPLICPLCGADLAFTENAGSGSLICNGGEKRHCYDLASSGYVNLLPPGKKRNAVAGDNKELVAARRRFLARGLYAGAADTLCAVCADLPGADSFRLGVDAGCGEGYYTLRIAEKLREGGPHFKMFGADASKFAADSAAKAAKASGISCCFSAANIFELPLPDACADLVVSMFAPVAWDEFQRILKKGGKLVIGSAGEMHLWELKEAIYDEPRPNVPLSETAENPAFLRVGVKSADYVTHLPDNEAVRELFGMTPYAYRTSPKDMAKLDALSSLDVRVQVDFTVFERI